MPFGICLMKQNGQAQVVDVVGIRERLERVMPSLVVEMALPLIAEIEQLKRQSFDALFVPDSSRKLALIAPALATGDDELTLLAALGSASLDAFSRLGAGGDTGPDVRGDVG